MPKIKVLRPFKFAHHGYQVEDFEPSDEPRETTQEVVEALRNEGLFEVEGETPAKPAGKKKAA